MLYDKSLVWSLSVFGYMNNFILLVVKIYDTLYKS